MSSTPTASFATYSATMTLTSITRIPTPSQTIYSPTPTATVTPPPTPTATSSPTITPPPTPTPTRSLPLSISKDTATLSEELSASQSRRTPTASRTISHASRSFSASATSSGPVMRVIEPFVPRYGDSPASRSTGGMAPQTAVPLSVDPFYYYPKLYVNAIAFGLPLAERTLKFGLFGGEFDLAAMQAMDATDPSSFFAACLTLNADQAPLFQSRQFQLWSAAVLVDVNTTTATVRLPQDPDYPISRAVSAEKIVIGFQPRCFLRNVVPSPHEFQVILMPGGSVTAAPPALVSLSAVDASNTASTIAAGAGASFVASALSLYLVRTDAAMALAECAGTAAGVGFTENPFSVRITPSGATDASLPPFIGGLVLNLGLCVAWMFAHYSIGFVVLRWRKSRDLRSGRSGYAAPWAFLAGWKRPLAAAAFPTRSLWLLVFFPSAVKCATVVLFTASDTAALAVATICLAPWLGAAVGVAFGSFKSGSLAFYIPLQRLERQRRRVLLEQHLSGTSVLWAPVVAPDVPVTAHGSWGRGDDDLSMTGVNMGQSQFRGPVLSNADATGLALPPVPLRSVFHRLFFRRGLWVDQRPSAPFIAFFRSCFAEYRGNRYRAFLSFEILISAVCACIDGSAVATRNCASGGIALVVTLAVHFLVILVTRPFDVLASNIFFVLLAGLQLLTAALSLAAAAQREGGAAFEQWAPMGRTAVRIGIVVQYIFVARAALELLRHLAATCLSATGQHDLVGGAAAQDASIRRYYKAKYRARAGAGMDEPAHGGAGRRKVTDASSSYRSVDEESSHVSVEMKQRPAGAKSPAASMSAFGSPHAGLAPHVISAVPPTVSSALRVSGPDMLAPSRDPLLGLAGLLQPAPALQQHSIQPTDRWRRQHADFAVEGTAGLLQVPLLDSELFRHDPPLGEGQGESAGGRPDWEESALQPPPPRYGGWHGNGDPANSAVRESRSIGLDPAAPAHVATAAPRRQSWEPDPRWTIPPVLPLREPSRAAGMVATFDEMALGAGPLAAMPLPRQLPPTLPSGGNAPSGVERATIGSEVNPLELEVDPLTLEESRRTVTTWFDEGLGDEELREVVSGAPRPPAVPPPAPGMGRRHRVGVEWDDL